MIARLALVGAPGCGKTAVAAELAERWSCPLLDTDALYEQEHGSSVGDAVIDDELAFRADEEQIVLDALRQPAGVVAVGSGAMSEAVRSALVALPVVWLQVGLVDAVRRSGLAGIRPVALGNIRAQMADMMAERAPWYEACADLVVATDGRAVAAVADEIEEWEKSR